MEWSYDQNENRDSLGDVPRPFIEPLDDDGNVRRADIKNGVAQIFFPINEVFLPGFFLFYYVKSAAGTSGSWIEVEDPPKMMMRRVPTAVSTKIEVWYKVDNDKGETIARSVVVEYDVTPEDVGKILGKDPHHGG